MRTASLLAIAASALVAACERDGPAAGRDSPSAAPADTVVYRVARPARLPRRPSAIQRVTGPVPARAAARPLDSVLAVRVLDARGAELPGASVRWSIATAGEGAALRVLDARTDSLGVSRAAFTPGRTADPQVVTAEVQDVGRIPFTVAVTPASARLVPEGGTLWPGESLTIAAELRDASDVQLAGGRVTWAARDTGVVRLTPLGATSARVTAVAAGATEVLGFTESGSLRASARVVVRPAVAGRLITADDGPLPPMRVEVRSGALREPIPVDDGAFAARLELAGDATFIHATAAQPGAYHDAIVRVDHPRDLQRLVIALVPTSVRIQGGTYDGQPVAIDAARAMERVGGGGRGASFWRLVPLSGTGPRRLLGWRDADFPLRVAFNRAGSRGDITAQDSIAFWAAAERMQRDLGRVVFAPAEIGDTARGRVIRVEVAPQAPEGHTFVSWEQAGDATDGVVLFRGTATLRDAQVVTHELVHLLGFGHASAWPSIASPAGGTYQRLTAEDVAYIQLALRLRALQERTGARPGLPVPSPAPR